MDVQNCTDRRCLTSDLFYYRCLRYFIAFNCMMVILILIFILILILQIEYKDQRCIIEHSFRLFPHILQLYLNVRVEPHVTSSCNSISFLHSFSLSKTGANHFHRDKTTPPIFLASFVWTFLLSRSSQNWRMHFQFAICLLYDLFPISEDFVQGSAG